jgi:Rps23 Pro-64 3,4-dihydroxylase Tpa1-like proline 4-hydroxylase
MMNRVEYGKLIQNKLEANAARLRDEFTQSGRVQTCYIDDLLPENEVREIAAAFPDKSEMMLRKSLREHKHVAAQMNQYKPLLEEIIYAFQEPGVVKIVSEICGLKDAQADTHLYAGGISLMAKDNFLNPHLDNSHDKDRDMYRVLNLLYYVTPDWKQENGGNLELWDNGPEGEPREIFSKFNRLALMATHKHSWHSVNQVKVDASRCCVSNYYFSPVPMEQEDYFHVTSFRGRPEQPVRDLVLQADVAVRQSIRKVFKKGIVENPHVYKKDEAAKVKVH